jgi:signal transduction histidine kinase
MSLESLKQLRKRIGFRLWLWYSVVFLIISLILFFFSYSWLSSFLSKRDCQSVELELKELAALYESGGIDSVRKEIAVHDTLPVQDSYYFRIAAPEGRILLFSHSPLYEKFQPERLEGSPPVSKDGWIRLAEEEDKSEFQLFGSSDTLEVASRKISDGTMLQVGRSTEYREDLLENFRFIFAISLIPLFLLGGLLLTFRGLRPLRGMLVTMKSIQAGNMESRVPVRHTNDELDELAKLFNSMLEKIQNLIGAMRNSLDNVAHDLRTPVTRLRVTAEAALQTQSDPEVYRDALSDCLDEADKILSMLDTLMDISEAESGSMKLNFDSIPVKRLLEDTVDLYEHVAEDKGLHVNLDCSDGLTVKGDRNRMRQVLANLLDNAIKYTDSGGTILLEAQESDHEIVIVIRDTGIGILPNELPHIWDRLYRSDQSRSQRGIGLGLSLVRAIVEAHNGRVEASSEISKGSSFRIYLPSAG